MKVAPSDSGNAPSAVAPALPDALAEELKGSLGNVIVHDLYGEVGSRIYQEISLADSGEEVAAMLSTLRPIKGPILELAAGAGRLTLPLLARGYEVTAIDLSGSMLDLLRQALVAIPEKKQQRCRVVQSDISDFDLGTTFGAAVLNATSISLLDKESRRSLFAAVARHLEVGGLMLLTTLEPTPSEDAFETIALELASGSYRLVQYLPPGSDRRVITVIPKTVPGEGQIDVFTSEVLVLNTASLVDELTAAGFAVEVNVVLEAGIGRILMIQGTSQ